MQVQAIDKRQRIVDFYCEVPFEFDTPLCVGTPEQAVLAARAIITVVNEIVPNRTSRHDRIWSPVIAMQEDGGNCAALSVLSQFAVDKAGITGGLCFEGTHFWNRIGTGEATTFFDSYFGFILSGSGYETVSIPYGERLIDITGTFETHATFCPDNSRAAKLEYDRNLKIWRPKNVSTEHAVIVSLDKEFQESLDEVYIPSRFTIDFMTTFLRQYAGKNSD